MDAIILAGNRAALQPSGYISSVGMGAMRAPIVMKNHSKASKRIFVDFGDYFRESEKVTPFPPVGVQRDQPATG